jgi:RHH-type transcriptional regulator, proline utilization regulon repressor / proline dehydrogenase / delta 1-pyrroline-5-carboxylate dehydrogenase
VDLDPVYLKAKELLEFHKEELKRIKLLNLSWWSQQVLLFSSTNPRLQKQLFKFVDLYPSLKTPEMVSRYLLEYMREEDLFLGDFLQFATRLPLGTLLLDRFTRLGVKSLAKNFIVDNNDQKLFKKIDELRYSGLDCTLDILGELAISKEESEKYLQAYLDLLETKPGIALSVKLSSLCPQMKSSAYELNKKILKDNLAKIFRAALENGSEITIDSEHYDTKTLFFDTIKELLLTEEFKNWSGAGVVIQAYLKESKSDLISFIEFSQKRKASLKIRLVKGAYWDYERAVAIQNNWNIPVYEKKVETDKNYEELLELLFKNNKYIFPAIASHNIRSIALTIELAKLHKVDKDRYEFQFLYGMLDHMKFFLSEHAYGVRVYLPCGDLVEGMAYLVRRLLENTANDSFLFQSLSDDNLDKLIAKPVSANVLSTELSEYRSKEFTNSPLLDFSKIRTRFEVQFAIEQLMKQLDQRPLEVYSIVNGRDVLLRKTFASINPSRKSQVVAYAHAAEISDVNLAVNSSKQAFRWWSHLAVQRRINIMKAFARLLERKRQDYAALLVLEVAKTWNEANAELSEAIDFIYYYVEQAERLFSENVLRSLPGEENTNFYKALGVTAVISPWNFPLAILLGMTSAALLAGNTVIIKPSEEAPAIAYKLVTDLNKVMRDSFPFKDTKHVESVLQLLLGSGVEIGADLVKHKDVNLITFTGSHETGMQINKSLNEHSHLKKKFIAEMGGKNAIVADETADLDQLIPAILKSAFSFSGQKCSACSRLILVSSIYEKVKERLVAAVGAIVMGPAYLPESDMTSLINEKAFKKFEAYFNLAKREASILVGNALVDKDSFKASPVIVENVSPRSALSRDEIFAPILSLFTVDDFNSAIDLANDSKYGLTGGRIFEES